MGFLKTSVVAGVALTLGADGYGMKPELNIPRIRGMQSPYNYKKNSFQVPKQKLMQDVTAQFRGNYNSAMKYIRHDEHEAIKMRKLRREKLEEQNKIPFFYQKQRRMKVHQTVKMLRKKIHNGEAFKAFGQTNMKKGGHGCRRIVVIKKQKQKNQRGNRSLKCQKKGNKTAGNIGQSRGNSLRGSVPKKSLQEKLRGIDQKMKNLQHLEKGRLIIRNKWRFGGQMGREFLQKKNESQFCKNNPQLKSSCSGGSFSTTASENFLPNIQQKTAEPTVKKNLRKKIQLSKTIKFNQLERTNSKYATHGRHRKCYKLKVVKTTPKETFNKTPVVKKAGTFQFKKKSQFILPPKKLISNLSPDMQLKYANLNR